MQIAPISQLNGATKLRRQFSEDGYCLLRGFFAPTQIQRIYDDMMAVFARQLQRLEIPQADWRDPAGLRRNLLALFNSDLKGIVRLTPTRLKLRFTAAHESRRNW